VVRFLNTIFTLLNIIWSRNFPSNSPSAHLLALGCLGIFWNHPSEVVDFTLMPWILKLVADGQCRAFARVEEVHYSVGLGRSPKSHALCGLLFWLLKQLAIGGEEVDRSERDMPKG